MAKTKRKDAPAKVGAKTAAPSTADYMTALTGVVEKPAKSKKVAPSVHSKSTPAAPKSNTTPTVEIAGEMQAAFDHFNATLFDGMDLPHCVLTLTRLRKYAGMFAPKRWLELSGKKADHHEIQLDAVVLREVGTMRALSTVAHEMCHLLIFVKTENAKEKHNPYHCKRWASAMNAIGLKPIGLTTDKKTKAMVPTGKETGANATHEIVKGGEFEKQAQALIDKGFKFSFGAVAEPEKAKKDKKPKKAGVKVKYTCSCCENSVWGKGGMKFTCQDGGEDFVQQGADDGGDE